MTGFESNEQLQDIERECLARFRQKAAEIQAAHPEMSSKICFCKAVEVLHQTASRYQWTRSVLQSRGIASLPLR